jgi:hypothetical protein
MSDKQLDIAKYTRHLTILTEHADATVSAKATELLNGLENLKNGASVTEFLVTAAVSAGEFSSQLSQLNYMRARIIELFEGTV